MNDVQSYRMWTDKEFYKMSGCGNDFIILDNRERTIAGGDVPEQVKLLCRRKTSIGADGLILIEDSDTIDFRWRFFNADGSEAEMCGNAGRCVARFAYMHGIAGREMDFETIAGSIHASVLDERRVKLQMTPPHDLHLDYELDVSEDSPLIVSSINTGVPHVAVFMEALENCPVVSRGRTIRYHDRYKPHGTNANFVSVSDDHRLAIRTYERGVEDETLACGTGSVAAALIAARKGLVLPPVSLKTQGGEILTIHFDMTEEGFDRVFLEGDTNLIYKGNIKPEAFLA